MADDPKATEPVEGEPENDEGKFWKMLDDRFDAAVERAVKKYTRPSGTRGGQRTTLPGAIANMFFGSPDNSGT